VINDDEFINMDETVLLEEEASNASGNSSTDLTASHVMDGVNDSSYINERPAMKDLFAHYTWSSVAPGAASAFDAASVRERLRSDFLQGRSL
jgi:hypothetical protein